MTLRRREDDGPAVEDCGAAVLPLSIGLSTSPLPLDCGMASGLGFEVAISVPFDNKLAFVSLQNGPLEIMYQSFDFSRATNPIGIEGVNRAVVFMETDALDEIIPVIEKYDVVIPDHITNRGSREIYVRDPAGNLIGFAQNNP